MVKNKYISELNNLGQSVWYDNLSRDVLNSGELKKLVDNGVSGLTSNPTIFKKAIADSDNYDTRIKSLIHTCNEAEGICEELMIEDVAKAADLLKPVFDQTNGADGYASIEVSPFLATDTEKTIQSAKKLWEKLSRPNIMIKIPATSEGIPAIRKTLAAGINVNVTLIFSKEVYKQVAEAYISALEDRVSNNLEVSGISSVASFFVSRVDSICEQTLTEGIKSGKLNEDVFNSYFGKVGIANSRVAYQSYLEVFSSERFESLKRELQEFKGLYGLVRAQNPKLKSTLYVEELAGPDTVNTLPPATLKALMEEADITRKIDSLVNESRGLLDTLNTKLQRVGTSFDNLLFKLQADGVKLFADSYTELLESIENKKKSLS